MTHLLWYALQHGALYIVVIGFVVWMFYDRERWVEPQAKPRNPDVTVHDG